MCSSCISLRHSSSADSHDSILFSLTFSVSRIALVRPERERSLQELLVRMARSGQLRGRVTDDQLLGLLDQVAQAEQSSTGAGGKSKITVCRASCSVCAMYEQTMELMFLVGQAAAR